MQRAAETATTRETASHCVVVDRREEKQMKDEMVKSNKVNSVKCSKAISKE